MGKISRRKITEESSASQEAAGPDPLWLPAHRYGLYPCGHPAGEERHLEPDNEFASSEHSPEGS